MEILEHFGTAIYARKIGIVLNFCEYCRFFLYDFLSQNSADIPSIDTTNPNSMSKKQI